MEIVDFEDADPIEIGKNYTSSIKIIFFLFLTFILITNDVFIKTVLVNIEHTYENGKVTTKGIIVQGIILVLLYLLFDTLIHYGIL